MPDFNYKKRTALLKDEMARRGLDSFLVTNETNVSYLSGFQGHDSLLLVTAKKDFFITDSRYIQEAQESVAGFDITPVEISTYATIADVIGKLRLKRTGFESMNLPYGAATRLKARCAPAKMFPVRDIVEELRSVKDAAEIEAIRRSIRLTRSVFDKLIRCVKPGASERSLVKIAEEAFIERGALPAFELIVASGANSSKPHARPTDAAVKDNSFVMIDVGVKLDGYCSDLTRMAVLGRVKEKFKKIYDIVRAAQERAIDEIRPFAKASYVDRAARGYIASGGFGKYFGHSLGHGVGMDVHEKPTISARNDGLLRKGMVFTVEPAIYIPHFGGVRIEDMVLVTDKGREVLTR